MTVLLTGLLTCLALIVAIGPQSAWLLRQGLRRDRVLLAIVCCLVGDVLLVLLGTAGVGVVLDHAPWLLEAIRWLGVSYLLWFAWRSFSSARSPQAGLELSVAPGQDGTVGSRELHVSMRSEPEAGGDAAGEADLGAAPSSSAQGLGPGGSGARPQTTSPRVHVTGVSAVTRVAGAGLAISLLNPHAWVDTLVVLGTMANTFGAEKWLFALGACLGSLLWFTLLGLGGSALAKPLNRPRTWQVIDVVVGLTMVLIAGLLAVGGF